MNDERRITTEVRHHSLMYSGKRVSPNIDRRYCPIGWNEQLKEILSLAIKIGVLPEIDVHEILDKKLKRSGRACFEDHVNRGTYPNHTFWPEALAYAIRKGEFSTEEIERICFDHGYSATTFIKEYRENDLLEEAIKAFLPVKNQ